MLAAAAADVRSQGKRYCILAVSLPLFPCLLWLACVLRLVYLEFGIGKSGESTSAMRSVKFDVLFSQSNKGTALLTSEFALILIPDWTFWLSNWACELHDEEEPATA